ncbi:PEP-CTERM sorting domain-containing protein [Rubritalea marina]|uniref:PEP-CTERM sorting domain-containing protein n=1 Tax=Rubritalea marina TaxID=361055 RepID=UPI001461686E|nr:PEP-CTERM sorting domain-containing protein [Rubritalea marina]
MRTLLLSSILLCEISVGAIIHSVDVIYDLSNNSIQYSVDFTNVTDSDKTPNGISIIAFDFDLDGNPQFLRPNYGTLFSASHAGEYMKDYENGMSVYKLDTPVSSGPLSFSMIVTAYDAADMAILDTSTNKTVDLELNINYGGLISDVTGVSNPNDLGIAVAGSVVPEPSTSTLLLGSATLTLLRRKRCKK